MSCIDGVGAVPASQQNKGKEPMKNENENVIEYKRPSQKDSFEVVFFFSIHAEAESEEHAIQAAKNEFEFSDLDDAVAFVHPVKREAAV